MIGKSEKEMATLMRAFDECLLFDSLPQGRAVQVDPINPTLNAPRNKRRNYNYDKLLSILLQYCFQIQLAPLYQGTTRALAGVMREEVSPPHQVG